MSSTSFRHARLLAVCAGAALMVGIAGCSTSDESSTSTSSTPHPSAAQSASSEATTHNADDVTFNQKMIPHHQQAIAMADLVPSRTENSAVRELATQIKNAQQPEIDQMTQRLASWGVSTTQNSDGSTDHGSMDHGSMSQGATDHGSMEMGMMSEQQMTDMENARGAAFDRLWLQGMISHHQGAIEMADTELAKGIDPASRTMAEQIKKTQQAEINRMRSLLGQ